MIGVSLNILAWKIAKIKAKIVFKKSGKNLLQHGRLVEIGERERRAALLVLLVGSDHDSRQLPEGAAEWIRRV